MPPPFAQMPPHDVEWRVGGNGYVSVQWVVLVAARLSRWWQWDTSLEVVSVESSAASFSPAPSCPTMAFGRAMVGRCWIGERQ